jgi:hypothetical protein
MGEVFIVRPADGGPSWFVAVAAAAEICHGIDSLSELRPRPVSPGEPTVSSKGGAHSIPSRLCVVAICCVASSWASRAAAQAIPGIELHWTAPPGCPSAEDLQRHVRHLLGPDAASATPKERLVVEGVVARANQRYKLSLGVRHGGRAAANRSFESDSCESLAGAAAVSLTLLARGGEAAWDQSGSSLAASPPSSPQTTTSSQPAPPSSPQATTSSQPPPARPPPPGPAPTPAPAPAPSLAATKSKEAPAEIRAELPLEDRWYAMLEAPLFAFDDGTLPSPSLGAGMGLGARRDRYDAVLAGMLWLDQSAPAPATESSFGAKYVRRTGKLTGCYALPFGQFDVGPCLTLALEYVTAQGTGPEVVGGPGRFAWITAGLAARARWSPARRTALFLRTSLALGTSRPTFAIDAVGPVFRVAAAAAGLDMGLEWIL